MECHQWQRAMCRALNKSPVCNVACKEDPAKLGDPPINAINLDINDYDPHTRIHGKDVRNFRVGDAKALPWEGPTFGTVVIGELLEHCTHQAARQILLEAKRVLLPSGSILCTFPLDPRPKEVQHAKHLLIEWSEGITSWHQTIWNDELFFPLLLECGLRLVSRDKLDYLFIRHCDPQGWGVVLEPL
jgi:SAM-dependent methyltransferase